MPKKRKIIGESSVIKKIQSSAGTLESAAIPATGLALAIGDDAAIWRPRAGYETVLTVDWFLEGTHFLANRHRPEMVAYKCLARAVSDIAAMGAEPRCFLLSLALPRARTGKWLDKFLVALQSTAQRFDCPLAGGDTTNRKEILINITVVGECKRGHAVLRSGASPGDAIFVTGRLGEAAYGWRLLGRAANRIRPSQEMKKHLFPQPRLAAGQWLAERKLATAMMDISDGLSTDLARLGTASGVGAEIYEALLPTVKLGPRDSNRKFDAIELALDGGDDYELLFAVKEKNIAHIPPSIGRVPVTRIGRVTTEKHFLLLDKRGAAKPLGNRGWDPFR